MSSPSTAVAAIACCLALQGCGGSAEGPSTPSSATPPPNDCASRTSYRTSDVALDALQQRFRPVLEANKKSFAGRTGTVQGFGAGSIYPQVWLRDSATILPATRYFYPRLSSRAGSRSTSPTSWPTARSGTGSRRAILPVHDQRPSRGQVYATGSVVLSADKNTTVADQESSAIDAAWRVYRSPAVAGGSRSRSEGSALVDRLDGALGTSSRSASRGLRVVAALTADWGDVSPTYADQRAIYLDEATPVVVEPLRERFFARAAEELAELLATRRGRTPALWSTATGGRVGAHRDRPSPLERGPGASTGCTGWSGAWQQRPAFDDSDVFALGGNALAALYGPATRHARGGSSRSPTRGGAPSASPRQPGS